jgi:peptidoglycan hydrolase-like protein with peptidoglycan-binding domain
MRTRRAWDVAAMERVMSGVMLEHGSTGRHVRALQEALREAGYDIDVDGDFGDATYAAVRDFQANNDLGVDGVVGPNTWAALGFEGGDDAKGGDDEGYEELAHGAEGELVELLQAALVAAGHEIDIDGIFGDGTERAVRRFQRDNELDVDGIVGANTWAALEEFMGDDEG